MWWGWVILQLSDTVTIKRATSDSFNSNSKWIHSHVVCCFAQHPWHQAVLGSPEESGNTGMATRWTSCPALLCLAVMREIAEQPADLDPTAPPSLMPCRWLARCSVLFVWAILTRCMLWGQCAELHVCLTKSKNEEPISTITVVRSRLFEKQKRNSWHLKRTTREILLHSDKMSVRSAVSLTHLRLSVFVKFSKQQVGTP